MECKNSSKDLHMRIDYLYVTKKETVPRVCKHMENRLRFCILLTPECNQGACPAPESRNWKYPGGSVSVPQRYAEAECSP